MKTIALWTKGMHCFLLISFTSCLTVDHFPRTPVQDESLTLICSLTSMPEDLVQWLVMDGSRYSYDCDLNVDGIIDNEDDPTNYNVTCDIQSNVKYQYNLTIHRLEKQQHQTTWKCNHLFWGVQLNVTVLVRADKPVWTPGAGNYGEGQLYSLTCSTNVADPVPSFSWWIVGPNNISSELAGASYGWQNETGIHNTIAFLPNRTLGGVDIWCKLNQSQFGELESKRQTVNVIYAPKQAETDASDVLGYVSGTVILNCSVHEGDLGNPETHWFEWRRASDDIVYDNNGADGHLALDLTSVDFDDVYTCYPTNAAGRGEPASINLTVWATPELNSELESITDTHYNTTLSLSCKCTSRPTSAVSWSGYVKSIFRQTSQQDSEQGDRIKLTQSEVLLEWHTDFLEERKHGSGPVTCRCVNSAGENETDTEINVQYPPTQVSLRSSHGDFVVVDEQTKTVTVSCQVSEENRGNPPIYNYTWILLRDGELPGDGPTAQNLTLYVNKNNLCLDNEYTCTAANTFGEAASDPVNVTLAVAPELEQPIDTQYDVRYDNDSFALDCRYNAKPEARVLWRDFNDEVFEAIDLAYQPNGDCNLMVYTSQRLQWRNNASLEQRKAGSGFVTCAADNGVGGGRTENVTINVQYPPVRTRGHPAVISVVASMTPRQVTLSCVVDDIDKGNPEDYVFNWIRQHGDIPVDYNTSGNLTLNLSRSSIFLDDVYTCYVENTIGSGRPANVTLAVQVMPVYVGDGSLLATVLNTDDDISLSCQYIARPDANITLTGYRQDVFSITEQEEEGVAEGQDARELLTSSWRNLTWTTTDVQLRKHGNANVTCSGNNGVGAPGDRIVQINVQYGPGAPALWFSNNVVYAGGTASMTCSFTPGPDGTDGNPTVTEYTWLFGNETLVDKNSSHVTLSVTSVTQEGEYTCYGTNHPLGGSIRGDASQPEYITVNVSPYLVQPSEPSYTVVILYNDKKTSLSCLGAGKPEVDFNWYHNGDQVDEEDFIEEIAVEAGEYLYDLQYGWRSYLMRAVERTYFTCDNITKYDGHYQCEAYNDEQMSNKSAPVRLITHYPAHWAGHIVHPTRYTSPGDNFTLLCDVCMEPRGNITWYLNGEPVRDNISFTDDGRKLTLTDVQLEDFGNYTCQVTNIILEENYNASFDISLVERGAPHTPHAFQVDGSTSRSLNVSWLPGSMGGYDSQTFTLCYVDYDVLPSCQVGIKDRGDGNFIRESIRDLEVNTTYQLQLYAENAHRGSNRSSLTEMIQSTKVAPVIKVIGLTLTATRVTVTWVVEAGEPSHLTLVQCPAEDCDVTTQRLRRDVKATWRELATNIPPDVGNYTYEAQEDEQFDVYSHNRFNLWAYEPGLNDRSNTEDDNASLNVHPRSSDAVDIALVVGIVLAVVAAAALATGGFVYYRKKSTKGGDEQRSKRPSHSDSNKGFRDDQDYGAYEDVTNMSIMATSRPHQAGPDVCVDVPMKLPFDEVDDDASYMGLHHHDNNDNNAYEELQVTETTT